MIDLPRAIFLMGPTASGKTALALQLYDEYPVEIISVDSALVYRDMDIGTSKPDAHTLKKYPHHLVNIRDPADAYSTAEFRNDALTLMCDIVSRGKTPLLVGGTMLYFRSLLQGLSDLPSANSDIRQSLTDYVQTHGLPALHERLKTIDPEAANRIHPNDPQRIQRAIEVYEISGIPMSEWWKKEKTEKLPYTVVKIAISPANRSVLHQRIEMRFREMLENGLIDEVERLRRHEDLTADTPSMRSVGYRQVWQYLDGDYSYDELMHKGIVATRQLAKRQLTWLRNDQAVSLIDSEAKDFQTNVLKKLKDIPK